MTQGDPELALGDEGFANQTNVHPVGLLALVVLGVTMMLVPRRWAAFPLILLACFIPAGQRITVMTLDFSFLRLMVLCGWVRILARGEIKGFVTNRLDWLVGAWALLGTVTYVLLFGTVGALVFKLGQSFDAFGYYFLFRCLLRKWEDIDRMILGIIIISVPVALCFLYERSTGYNPFSVFGGVREITKIRQGRLRCQGAFTHPILAGCFWAGLLPLILSRLWRPGAKISVMIGGICSLAIIYACSSSTPVLMVMAGMVAALAWYIRSYMSVVRWVIAGTVLGLHIVMKAPVWHLISRIQVVGGNMGWHRYQLIDEAVNHLDEWFLIGTQSTRHWGKNLFDVTNQYILEGTRGGVGVLILYVLIIAFAFRNVGRSWRLAWPTRWKLALIWGVGASIFAQSVSLFAVSYSGQIIVLWYMALALTANLVNKTRYERRARLLKHAISSPEAKRSIAS